MMFAILNGNSSGGVNGQLWTDLFKVLEASDYKITAAEEKAYGSVLNTMKVVLEDVKTVAARP